MLNSKFTSSAGEFALKFAHYKYNLEKTLKIKTDIIKQLNLSKTEVKNISDLSVFE